MNMNNCGHFVKQYMPILFSALIIVLSLSCGSPNIVKRSGDSDNVYDDFDNERSGGQSLTGRSSARSREHEKSVADNAAEPVKSKPGFQASFRDHTQEIVSHAERLIETNQKEGAVLDQRWYGLKYFGKHQDLVFGAGQVRFFGGLENDVRRQLEDRYTSIDPVESNQDSGDIRMFIGKRKDGKHDFLVIGQNGREVALKTIIRLIYLAKFADEQTKQQYRDKLESFSKSLQILMSTVSARQEFIGFFNRHGIGKLDAVIIGFRGDVRSLMKEEGIRDPESYTDESLRVNLYPNANGKTVLLVSIDKNRIFASRSGELVEAIFAISANAPPSITLLGSGGAIDAPEMVGKIVTPTSVMNGDSFPAHRNKGVLVHIIRNGAADEAIMKTANVTVESVVVETTKWVTEMKNRRVNTVDQELFHIMNAINSSAYADQVEAYVGTLVVDNVSSDAADAGMTLEHAEKVISETADVRRGFLSKVLNKMGILKNGTSSLPRRSQPRLRRGATVQSRIYSG
jgi:hypothetical protein